MIWIILISSLALLLFWILVVPVILFVDTNRNRYFLTLPGIFRAAAIPAEGLFRIRIWVFFIPFTFNPFLSKGEKQKKGDKGEKPEKKQRPKEKSKGGFLARGRMAIHAMRAFRIRRLELDIDTDDFILNAWLIPVFSAVNSDHIQMRANFTGRASLLMDVRVRLGSLLWSMVSQKIKSLY